MTALFRKAQKRKQARLKPCRAGRYAARHEPGASEKQKRLSRTLFGLEKPQEKSNETPGCIPRRLLSAGEHPSNSRRRQASFLILPLFFSAGGRTAPCSNAAFRQAPASGRPAPSATASFRPG